MNVEDEDRMGPEALESHGVGEVFAALAEPIRRRIVEELAVRESNVGQLVARLGVGQPKVSKHLRVLRDNGLVSSRVAAQRRVYALEADKLAALDEWIQPYRRLWNSHPDATARQ